MNLLQRLLSWPLRNVVLSGDSTGAPREPSPANERAQKLLAAHRKATAARLADCPPDTVTRQQKRAAQRRAGKMPLTATQATWHAEKGLPDAGHLATRVRKA